MGEIFPYDLLMYFNVIIIHYYIRDTNFYAVNSIEKFMGRVIHTIEWILCICNYATN